MNKKVNRRRSSSGKHQGIDADSLELQSEKTRRQWIGNKAGERRLGHHGVLGRGRQTRADERRAGEDQRVTRWQGLYDIGGKFTEKTCAKTDAAKAWSQTRLVEIAPWTFRGIEVDMQKTTMKTVHD